MQTLVIMLIAGVVVALVGFLISSIADKATNRVDMSSANRDRKLAIADRVYGLGIVLMILGVIWAFSVLMTMLDVPLPKS